MKSALALVLFAGCCPALLSETPPAAVARPAPVLDELVRMAAAGSPEDAVLAYARARRRELPAEIGDRELARLRQSGVPERVVTYLTAIDVRPVTEWAQDEATSGDGREASGASAYESYGAPDSEWSGGSDTNGYAPTDHAANGYDASLDYPYSDPYPYFGFGYSPDFFVVGPPIFRGFGGRDRRFHRRRSFEPRRVSHDGWRERGFRRGLRGPITLRPRASRRADPRSGGAMRARRTVPAQRGFPPAGAMSGSSGFRPPRIAGGFGGSGRWARPSPRAIGSRGAPRR